MLCSSIPLQVRQIEHLDHTTSELEPCPFILVTTTRRTPASSRQVAEKYRDAVVWAGFAGLDPSDVFLFHENDLADTTCLICKSHCQEWMTRLELSADTERQSVTWSTILTWFVESLFRRLDDLMCGSLWSGP